MKQLLLISGLCIVSFLAKAQYITNNQILPANPAPTANLKLVLELSWGNCGRSLNYSVTRTGSDITVNACLYNGPAPAMPCIQHDTVALGQLPAGTYNLVIIKHLALTLADCSINPPTFPIITNSFSVGTALASRSAAASWHFSPTVVPATTSALEITGAPALREVSIYDLTGREQAHFETSALSVQGNTTRIPLPQLPPALYLLRVVDHNGQTNTQRFIRQ